MGNEEPEDWPFSAYPVSVKRQVDPGESPPGTALRPYLAKVEGWWWLNGFGDTPEEARADLEARFDEAKRGFRERGEPVPAPGEQVPVDFAARDRLDAHTELEDDYIKRVLNLPWAWFSDLTGLHEIGDAESFVRKTREVYGVDVADLRDASIADILDRIAAQRSRLQSVFACLLELDKLKAVLRKVRPTGLDRFENPAEHSWHVAMMAFALAPYAAAPVNLERVVSMLLVHDVGEIDAGDVMVFAEGGWEQQKAAERRGVERIFGMLPAPAGPALLALWTEFEEAQTAESRFAHALDRAIPVLLNLANDGGSWREHRISYERVIARVGAEVQAGCPALWDYLAQRLEVQFHAGWFGMAPVN